jgi:hypothetical protein
MKKRRWRFSWKRLSLPWDTGASLVRTRAEAIWGGRVPRSYASLRHMGRHPPPFVREPKPHGAGVSLVHARAEATWGGRVPRSRASARHVGRACPSQARDPPPRKRLASLARARVLPVRNASVIREECFRMRLNAQSVARDAVALFLQSQADDAKRRPASTPRQVRCVSSTPFPFSIPRW